ncbi:MAG: heavy-metal-associated domain-containing protein [Porphyromonadaceae bacterium]|nr:heavy-metal-associated domain-containing protein [Porphyromonadaceae bacterium]
MKNKLFIVIALLVGLTSINAQTKKENGKSKHSEVVFFIPNMHGDHCKKIIEKEIPFEKGVKDLIFDLKEQKLKIVYQSQKTTPEKLQKALEKMGYEVKSTDKKDITRNTENRSCCRS